MDIPFLSSTWAPDSSDTHCTSSEQSILQSCTCYSAAECERLNLRAQARSGSALSSSSVGANSCNFRLKWKSVSGSLAHCEESLLRVVWLCTLHHLAALIIYLTSTFFFCMMSTNTPMKRKILFWKKSRSTSCIYMKRLSLCDLFHRRGFRVPGCRAAHWATILHALVSLSSSSTEVL